MADVKWIKFSTDMFNDEKIQLIEGMPEGDAMIVIWCKLLCLAGRVNDGGYIHLGQNLLYTDEMFASVFHKPVNTVRLALATFEQFGMIENTEAGLYLTNWGYYQNVAGMEQQREKNRLRNIAYRQRKQLPSSDGITHDITVTSRDAPRKKKEERREKNITTPTPSKRNYADRVELTEDEYQNLVKELGEDGAKRCVTILDTYKGANGKTYKSDYLAIKNWVVGRYAEEKAKLVKLGVSAVPEPAATATRWVAQRPTYDEDGRKFIEIYRGYFMTEAQAREWAGDEGEVNAAEIKVDYQSKPQAAGWSD